MAQRRWEGWCCGALCFVALAASGDWLTWPVLRVRSCSCSWRCTVSRDGMLLLHLALLGMVGNSRLEGVPCKQFCLYCSNGSVDLGPAYDGSACSVRCSSFIQAHVGSLVDRLAHWESSDVTPGGTLRRRSDEQSRRAQGGTGRVLGLPAATMVAPIRTARGVGNPVSLTAGASTHSGKSTQVYLQPATSSNLHSRGQLPLCQSSS